MAIVWHVCRLCRIKLWFLIYIRCLALSKFQCREWITQNIKFKDAKSFRSSLFLIFISIFSSVRLKWAFLIENFRCRRKRFTFSSSSQDPQGQFQSNLSESIIGGTYYTTNFLNKVIKKYTNQFWISHSLICLNCF